MEKTKFDNYPIRKTKQNFKMTIILNGKTKLKCNVKHCTLVATATDFASFGFSGTSHYGVYNQLSDNL